MLYVILDRELLRDRNLAESARAAVAGGADFIQYRDKISSNRDFFVAARLLREVLSGSPIPLIINDRLDLALSSGAEGVHLGAEDESVASARKKGGKELIIGASARTPERARRAESAGADYLGVGAFFSTATKTDAPEIGRKVFAEICSHSKIPVVAIGGISRQNLALPMSLGAAGIAVAAAVSVPDIRAAVSRLRRALDQL